MLHPPTQCDVPPFSPGGPGIPYFVVDGVPRAGHPFRVQWSTKPTTPGEPPSLPAILVVSLAPSRAVPLDGIGAIGCHAQVAPDFLMVPHPGSILVQDGGRISLDWTPPWSLVGVDFYGQLMVHAPGVNAAGLLFSPALHIQIGL